MIEVYHQDNWNFLQSNLNKKYSLIYIDPPFNTGKIQKRKHYANVQNKEVLAESSYNDSIEDYIEFIHDRVAAAKDMLTNNGSFFIHVDPREVHYVKVELDKIFSRSNFMNEIIWSFDYGARSTRKWSCKHNNILWYVKDTKKYIFNYDKIDRIPYMAPDLVGPVKAARGKTPTDTWENNFDGDDMDHGDYWWSTIVGTNSREKANYVTQKPLKILERIIKVHSNPGDSVLDFFAGSGSLGHAAALHGRSATLVDCNPQAIEVMARRFTKHSIQYEIK